MATVTYGITTASTSQASSYTTGSFTPTAGDLLLAFVVATGTTAAGSMSDSQSLGWTKIDSATKAAGADTIYLFISNATAAASSTTVTFDCSGDNGTGAAITVFGISGMSKTGAAASKQTAKQSDQSAGTPAPAFGTSALTENPTLGVIGNATNPAGMTPPSGWTEQGGSESGYGSPTTGIECVFRQSGFTGTTITWGSSSASAFGSLIVELDSSGGTTHEAAASLSGAGTLAALAVATLVGAAALSGSGALASVATVEHTGVASISGTGTLAAAAVADYAGASALSGTATLDAVGAVQGVVEGAAAMTGTATLAAVAAVEVTGVGSVSGAASVAASALVERNATAALSASASVDAVAVADRAAVAALSGVGSLSAAAVADYAAAAVIGGSAAIMATGTVPGGDPPAPTVERNALSAYVLDRIGWLVEIAERSRRARRAL